MVTMHAVQFDETADWNLGSLAPYVDEIVGVYACEDVRTYCCSLTPSVWCEPLYSFPVFNEEYEYLSDVEQELVKSLVNDILCNGGEACYRDWHDVQNKIAQQKAPALMVEEKEDALEYWRGNCPI